MKIAGYTLAARVNRSNAAILRAPRTRIVPTLGGVRVSTQPGDIADDFQPLQFDFMGAAPARTIVRTYADTNVVADSLLTDGRLAYKIPGAAGAFRAISAARIRLKKTAPLAGYVQVEVWDGGAGVPNAMLGRLGILRAEDLNVAWANYDFFARVAWPIGAKEAWLVLNGDEVTAGQVDWAGELEAPNAHAALPYAGRSTGAVAPVVDMTVWPLEVNINIAVDGGAPNAVAFNWAGCNSGVLIAAQMQTVIQALGGAFAAVTVVYVPDAGVTDRYLVTSGTTGVASAVVITPTGANDCTDELNLGVADGGGETTGGIGWGLANGELCGTVWQGDDYPVLLGIMDVYGEIAQEVEVEFDSETRVYTAIVSGVDGRYILEPWALDADGRVVGVRVHLALTGEL